MMQNKLEREHKQTLCRMCDDHCALNVYLEDGKIVDIDGYAHHPWNKGRTCSKARAAIDMIYHPDRLLKPLKKTGKGWLEIELEQALDEIAEKVKKIQKKYGSRGVTVWKGEATGFNQQEELAKRFCQALGSPNYLSVDSICFTARYLGYAIQYGDWTAPDFANSSCILLWGANPPTSHPFMTRMIMEGKQKGAKLIVVDPRLSYIARQADIHIPLKPGTDGALALGLINIMIGNNWSDKEFIENHTVGFEKLAQYAGTFTLDFLESETGISAKTISEVASLLFKSSPRITNYVGNGIEHYNNGFNNIRAISCLDAVCGSFDSKGGNLLIEDLGSSKLTLHDEIPLEHLEPITADKFPVLYNFRHECNTMTVLNTLITGEPYPIKGLILTAANPIMTNPNSLKVKKALQNLDLLVVRDLFMTESAKLADYVLPAASFLERTELHCHRVFQSVALSKKILSFPNCQDEYQFWHDMAHRLGFGKYFPWQNEAELNKWLLEPTGITVEELDKHPEGIEYKPLRYCKWKKQPIPTSSGKVELASAYLKNLGYPELPEYEPPEYLSNSDLEYPFVLITGARKVLYYHSRLRNIPRFRKAIPGPEVEMHPQDAGKLEVCDGDTVKITSRVGSVEIQVKIMAENEILPGNLQVTHGWKEANINILTHDDILDPVSGYPLLKGVQVKVEKSTKKKMQSVY